MEVTVLWRLFFELCVSVFNSKFLIYQKPCLGMQNVLKANSKLDIWMKE